jgi:hypothetical protein
MKRRLDYCIYNRNILVDCVGSGRIHAVFGLYQIGKPGKAL